MKNKVLLLSTFLCGILSAQINVPEVTKALYNKKTASWCGPCGTWGTETNDEIEDLVGDKMVSFKLTASSSGSLYSPICEELYDNYINLGDQSWPNFYVNAERYYQSNGGLTSNCSNAVIGYYNGVGADVNAGFTAEVVSNTLFVDVSTKFFNAMEGTYMTAVYILENNISYNQTGIEGTATGDHIMRASIAGETAFGDVVATDTIEAGTIVNETYGIWLDDNWDMDELHVITVIWKDNGDSTYSFVNANDGLPEPLDVNELSLSSEVQVYPNPVMDRVHISFEKEMNATVSIFNVTGEKIAPVQRSMASKSLSIDMSDFSTGLYWVEILDDNNNKWVRKIVKE